MVQVAAVLLWFSLSRCTGDVCSRGAGTAGCCCRTGQHQVARTADADLLRVIAAGKVGIYHCGAATLAKGRAHAAGNALGACMWQATQ
jgi:hypothetical protein